jgi:hypothetical protein
MIENCHWGRTVPNATWCPFNMYRTSGDVRASYGSVLLNLQTTVKFAEAGNSRPGCWAYPDSARLARAYYFSSLLLFPSLLLLLLLPSSSASSPPPPHG